MASQDYACVRSLPSPLMHRGGGTSSLALALASPMQVVWASDASIDSFAAGLQLTSLYDGVSTTFDGSTFVWLVVLVKGSKLVWVNHEADYGTLNTLVETVAPGAKWAVYARVDGDQVYPLAQV